MRAWKIIIDERSLEDRFRKFAKNINAEFKMEERNLAHFNERTYRIRENKFQIEHTFKYRTGYNLKTYKIEFGQESSLIGYIHYKRNLLKRLFLIDEMRVSGFTNPEDFKNKLCGLRNDYLNFEITAGEKVCFKTSDFPSDSNLWLKTRKIIMDLIPVQSKD